VIAVIAATFFFDLALARWLRFSDQNPIEEQEDLDVQTAPRISNASKDPNEGTPRSAGTLDREFKDFIQEEEDEEVALLLPELPPLQKKYTGYGFSQ
jgi:hypothetical protein